MKTFILTKIRLSWFFIIFFFSYLGLLYILPRFTFEGGALTLFSVNSFLYGFYISPILSAQKARIEEMHKIVRSEANAIFAIMLSIKGLPKSLKESIKIPFVRYIKKSTKGDSQGAEKEYENLITYCVDYKGAHKESMDKLLEKLVANQQNRTNFTMQATNKVYSNEWMIMLVLFSITLSFILFMDTGDTLILKVVTALLATGLSMLMLILVKLSTLTHKKARRVWEPFHTLIATKFYRIDQ